jgi:hypothetical protein
LGLGIENIAMFYEHLEYFAAIWYNLQPFGIVCGHLVYFSVLVCLDQEKSGNPDLECAFVVSCIYNAIALRSILDFTPPPLLLSVTVWLCT